MSATQARKIALSVLAKHNRDNKVSVRSTNFDCQRFGNNYFAVLIKDWTADPIARTIEQEIKTEGDAQRIPLLVEFSGKGIISAR